MAVDVKPGIYRIGNEAFWVLGGQVGLALGSLVGIKILTRLLVPYEFGRMSVALTLVQLVTISMFGPLGQGLMRYWSMSQDRGKFQAYVHSSQKFILFLIGLAIVLSFASGAVVKFSRFAGWEVMVSLSVICGAFSGWSDSRIAILRAARKRRSVCIINTLTAFGKPIMAAVLIGLLFNNAEYAIAGFLIAALISGLFAEWVYRGVVNEKRNAMPHQTDAGSHLRIGHDILVFSSPLFLWAIFGWAHNFCDRWALLTFQGADVVGGYTVISQLATYPLLFGTSFLSTLLLPIAYDRAGPGDSGQIFAAGNRILILMVVLYSAGAILLVLIYYAMHDPIVLIISNPNYMEYAHMLPLLTISWALYFLGQSLTGFGFLANRPKIYLMPIFFSAIIAFLTTFLLVPVHGPKGAIWGLGVAGLVYAAWCGVIALRLVRYN